MTTRQYVALLRGINVGGRNKVAMSDLRAEFEGAGYGAVRTYIQSGNVLFESATPREEIEPDIESVLDRRLGLQVVVVVRSHQQMRNVVRRAPRGFGTQTDTFHSDAIFLKAPLTPDRTLGLLDPREGVDRTWPGPGVVYFERLSARLGQSRMSRVTGIPEYAQMTIRNWSTTTTLLDLLDEHRAA